LILIERECEGEGIGRFGKTAVPMGVPAALQLSFPWERPQAGFGKRGGTMYRGGEDGVCKNAKGKKVADGRVPKNESLEKRQ